MLPSIEMVRDERRTQVAGALAVFAGIAGLFALVVIGTRLSGLAGEFFARIAGIMATPFLMEGSLCVLGFIVVMLLNHWRQRREGDECVYLDEIEDGHADLPAQARWAVYREKPLAPEVPAASDLLEGALAIGDHSAAIEILSTMSDAERHQPETMRQRIALARATGKEDLARRLEAEMAG